MYKLTLGSVNEVKYSSSAEHGLFSGTIETDRVVIVDSDGKYLQVDGNWGTDLKNGLVRTWSATLDKAEVDLLKAKYTAKSADTAAVYVYDGLMKLQRSSSCCVGARGPRGATQCSRSGGAAVRRYPSFKVRSNCCALLE